MSFLGPTWYLVPYQQALSGILQLLHLQISRVYTSTPSEYIGPIARISTSIRALYVGPMAYFQNSAGHDPAQAHGPSTMLKVFVRDIMVLILL